MNSREFRKLSVWVDYNRPFLDQLTYQQKVAWFRRRLNVTLIKPLKYLYRGVSRSSQQSAVLIFATSVCCAIEAMGKFRGGRKVTTNRGRFKAFLKEFMDRRYLTHTIQGETYEHILWKYFRNGLAHGFTILHGGFEHQGTYFKNKKNSLLIDPKSFLDDFLDGIEKYLDDLERASESDKIAQNFRDVFEKVFIKGE